MFEHSLYQIFYIGFSYIIQIHIKLAHTVRNLKGKVCCLFSDCPFDGSWDKEGRAGKPEVTGFRITCENPLKIPRKKQEKILKAYKNMGPNIQEIMVILYIAS